MKYFKSSVNYIRYTKKKKVSPWVFELMSFLIVIDFISYKKIFWSCEEKCMGFWKYVITGKKQYK